MNGYSLNDCKKVYFVGIGGVSMSALALILKSRGISVLGYDRSPSHETEILENHGVEISYTADSPKLENVDLLVYTAAVNESHPIVAEALKRGIPCICRSVLLGDIGDGYAVSIGVSGTHGKSTTSGMISKIYTDAPGHDPSFAVGALLPFINAYCRVGKDDTFIYEADEYKDSFLQFRPTTAVVLNVYHDHPDYYKDVGQVIRSFAKYISSAKNVVINLDCENTPGVIDNYKGNVFTFSADGNEKADFYATDVDISTGYASYTLHHGGSTVAIKLSVPGLHNVANSLAAYAACFINGLEPEVIASGIASFCGVARRFEKFGTLNGATLISDYAHHPDEIRACLGSAKRISKNKVITVFQAHTYSRLKGLYDAFVESLGMSDVTAVTDVFAARETDDLGMSGEKLAHDIGGTYVPSFEAAAEFIRENACEGDLAVVMGAGDIYKVCDILKKMLDK